MHLVPSAVSVYEPLYSESFLSPVRYSSDTGATSGSGSSTGGATESADFCLPLFIGDFGAGAETGAGAGASIFAGIFSFGASGLG